MVLYRIFKDCSFISFDIYDVGGCMYFHDPGCPALLVIDAYSILHGSERYFFGLETTEDYLKDHLFYQKSEIPMLDISSTEEFWYTFDEKLALDKYSELLNVKLGRAD